MAVAVVEAERCLVRLSGQERAELPDCKEARNSEKRLVVSRRREEPDIRAQRSATGIMNGARGQRRGISLERSPDLSSPCTLFIPAASVSPRDTVARQY